MYQFYLNNGSNYKSNESIVFESNVRNSYSTPPCLKLNLLFIYYLSKCIDIFRHLCKIDGAHPHQKYSFFFN